MEFRDKTVTIGEGEFIIVPRGVEHLPNAKDEVCCFVCAGNYVGHLNMKNEITKQVGENMRVCGSE